MSSGGLLQLVATGEEDKYLNNNPTVNFFDVAYQRYENFGREPVITQFTGQAGNERLVSADIPRTADLLHKLYLRIKVKWTLQDTDSTTSDDFWRFYKKEFDMSVLFKSATLSIGGREIQTIDGHVATVFDTSKTGFMAQQSKSLWPTFKNGTDSNVRKSESEYMYVPLSFWFTEAMSQALPLISLSNQVANVSVQLAGGENNKRYLVPERWHDDDHSVYMTADIESADLVMDMVYLNNEVRQKMATEERRYLIHQFQTTSSSVVGQQVQMPLYFKHPVTCIFWKATNGSQESKMKSCQLSANGVDLTPWMDAKYFKYITNHQSINRPEPASLGYHMYSWAKNPMSVQPSGSLNFSRIEKAVLKVKFEQSFQNNLVVNAINFNVLIFTSGMAGLLFQ